MRRAFVAYSESGGRSLTEFLDDWHAEVQPITPAVLATKSAAVQEVYKLFEEYWNPMDLTRYSKGIENSPPTTHHGEQEYLVVQESVRYRTSGCEPLQQQCAGPIFDVNDFRPVVRVPGKKILYQTAAHTGPIQRFINAGITNQEIEARIGFVAAAIGVNVISCDPCYTFSSDPRVWLIDFTPDLTRAELLFSVGETWGLSTLEKVSGTWRITASSHRGTIN